MYTLIAVPCEECETDFLARITEVKQGRARFCGRECYFNYLSRVRTGKNNRMWKDVPSYRSLHQWVERALGKPSLCVDCKTTEGKFQWANISGEYKRDLTDWKRLCTFCHNAFDDVSIKCWATRKARYVNGYKPKQDEDDDGSV